MRTSRVGTVWDLQVSVTGYFVRPSAEKTRQNVSHKVGDGLHTNNHRRATGIEVTGRTKLFIKADLDTRNRLRFFVATYPNSLGKERFRFSGSPAFGFAGRNCSMAAGARRLNEKPQLALWAEFRVASSRCI